MRVRYEVVLERQPLIDPVCDTQSETFSSTKQHISTIIATPLYSRPIIGVNNYDMRGSEKRERVGELCELTAINYVINHARNLIPCVKT